MGKELQITPMLSSDCITATHKAIPLKTCPIEYSEFCSWHKCQN